MRIDANEIGRFFRMRSWGYCALAAALLSGAGLISCARSNGESSPESRAAANPSELPVAPAARVERKTLTTELTLTGEFIPYQEVDVMAKEAGYIKTIRVDIGDRVHTGEKLAELEIPEMQNDMARAAAAVEASDADITTARNDLSRAQAAFDIAHLSYTRIVEVSKKEVGLVPQQEVDEAHSRELGAEAQLSAAKSTLDAAQRKAGMSRADQARWATLQKYTLISAPFDGVITKRYANTGAMIQQGTSSDTQAMPVVRLSQNNLLRLILPVPESAVPQIRVGETVDVTVNSLQKAFPGRVTRFADKISMATRTMDTEVDVPNPRYVLVPGMYAEVDLRLKQSKDALTVPIEAIDESDAASPKVYAVRDSTIHIIPITAGIRTPLEEEVRTGLQDGDVVILGRRAGLKDGQKIRVKLMPAADEGAPARKS
jgi:RND family efflux transporter MFP subunit